MELDEMTDSNIDYILSNIDMDSERLTDKERDEFLPSVKRQWKKKRELSPGQKKWLGDIWDKLP